MTVTPELLRQAQRGEQKAQYDLYRICYPVLMSVSARYRQDEQSAVASLNNCFLKIIQNLDRYRQEVPFEAWIRRIMINLLIDEFRKEKKWRQHTVFPENFEQETKHQVDWNEADQRFDAQQLEGLVRRLPPVTQQVFNLFALDGFSHREIAEMLKITDGTSKWHVSFARSQLQKWIRLEISMNNG